MPWVSTGEKKQQTDACLTDSETLCCRSPDHRGVVSAEAVEQLPHVLLGRVRCVAVHGCEQGARGRARGEPVAGRESLEEGKVVLGELSRRELNSNLSQRVGCLGKRRKVEHDSVGVSVRLTVVSLTRT